MMTDEQERLPPPPPGSTASSNASEEDDSDGARPNNCLKDRRREAHTQAEQKRRDSIKKGYDTLQELIPTMGAAGQDAKLSKATVLQKSIDYMQYLQSAKREQEEELAALQKEAQALEILRMNYEAVVAEHRRRQPGGQSRHVSEQLKFEVFKAFLDSLYQTFAPSVSTTDFPEMSGSAITWLENHCKPQILRDVMAGVMQQVHEHEASLGGSVGKVEERH